MPLMHEKHHPLNLFVTLNKSEFTSTFTAKHAVQDFGLKQIKDDTKKCISLGGKLHLAPKQILCSIFTQQKQTEISNYCPSAISLNMWH
jgi:hypothetical protein